VYFKKACNSLSPCWRTTRPGTWLLHKPRSFSNALSSAKRWPTLCDKCLDSVLHFTPTGIFTLKLRLWQAWSSCEQLKASLQFFALRQLTTACRTVSLCCPSRETSLNPSLNSTTALNQGQDAPYVTASLGIRDLSSVADPKRHASSSVHITFCSC